MIRSFGSNDTEKVSSEQFVKGLPHEIQERALEKLMQLDSAAQLDDLRVPPSNRLHPLKKELKDFNAININDQWRVIFIWKDGGADKVKITDYH